MLYYTIYVKNLHNGTGYIDLALENDELLKDYQHFLDVGLITHKLYPMKTPGGGGTGWFTINFHEVSGMTVTPPQKSIPGKIAPPRESRPE